MSWNVEKFSLINRLNADRHHSVIHSDLYLLLLIGRTIHAVNPDIVCFIELDIRTKTEVINTLRSLLIDEWVFLESPAVEGGIPAGAKVDNELFLVIYKKNKLTHYTPPQIINRPHPGLLRGVFECKFNFKGEATSKFTLWVAHLVEATKAKSGPELGMLNQLAQDAIKAPNNAIPLIITGDLNATYIEIIPSPASPFANDLLNAIKVQAGNKFKDLMVTTRLIFSTDSRKYSNSLAYRFDKTGVDDIIIINDGINKPQMNTAQIPSSGILDIINLYQLERNGKIYPPNDDISHLTQHLMSLNPDDLIRKGHGPGGQPTNYGQKLESVPDAKGEKRTQALLNNAWARYMGGISDHLPVIMTIDIDTP